MKKIIILISIAFIISNCSGSGSNSNNTDAGNDTNNDTNIDITTDTYTDIINDSKIDSYECIDNDGDNYGQGADCLGEDCDDNDPNNWHLCDGCVDGDHDNYYTGCDAYITKQQDCDDSIPECNESCNDIDDDNIYDCIDSCICSTTSCPITSDENTTKDCDFMDFSGSDPIINSTHHFFYNVADITGLCAPEVITDILEPVSNTYLSWAGIDSDNLPYDISVCGNESNDTFCYNTIDSADNKLKYTYTSGAGVENPGGSIAIGQLSSPLNIQNFIVYTKLSPVFEGLNNASSSVKLNLQVNDQNGQNYTCGFQINGSGANGYYLAISNNNNAAISFESPLANCVQENSAIYFGMVVYTVNNESYLKCMIVPESSDCTIPDAVYDNNQIVSHPTGIDSIKLATSTRSLTHFDVDLSYIRIHKICLDY